MHADHTSPADTVFTIKIPTGAYLHVLKYACAYNLTQQV